MVVGHIKISPDPPIRFTHAGDDPQQVVIVIEPSFDRTLILVGAPPRGGPFSWPATKAVVEAGATMRVPITFTPSGDEPAHATLTIDARHPDFFGRRREFPVTLPIDADTK
ncbi:MAG: hypothetical protein E6K21_19590 [Gammaproteobacteria bacterium]|nr:MAG: hypothetical protein E6K21_19590 [Gammaproteobacteria bacterium]